MAKLSDLSDELLLQIGSYLRQAELLNLSLVSKWLRSGTEAELFREYTAVYKRASFDRILKRVIGQPELARSVKYVHLKPWTTLRGLDWRYWKYEEEGDALVPEIRDLRKRDHVYDDSEDSFYEDSDYDSDYGEFNVESEEDEDEYVCSDIDSDDDFVDKGFLERAVRAMQNDGLGGEGKDSARISKSKAYRWEFGEETLAERMFMRHLDDNVHLRYKKNGDVTFWVNPHYDKDPEDLPDEKAPAEDYWNDVDTEKAPVPETSSQIDENFLHFYDDNTSRSFYGMVDEGRSLDRHNEVDIKGSSFWIPLRWLIDSLAWHELNSVPAQAMLMIPFILQYANFCLGCFHVAPSPRACIDSGYSR